MAEVECEDDTKITVAAKFNKEATDRLTEQLFIRVVKPPGPKEKNPHEITHKIVENGLVGSLRSQRGHEWRILGMRQKRLDESHSTEYDVERIPTIRECEDTTFTERMPINKREHVLKLCRFDSETDQKSFMTELYVLREVLSSLKHRRHRDAFPSILDVGETKQLRYINLLKEGSTEKYLDITLDKPRPFYILEKMDPNLETVFNCTKAGYLNCDTSVYLTIGAMRALRFLHDCGIVHRNVQPASFAIRFGHSGLLQRSESELMDRVVLVDLTRCRKYLSPDPLCKPRRLVPFVGNLKYSSIPAMEMVESTLKDDLVGCLWMLIEFVMGQIPWAAEKDFKQILEAKQGLADKEIEGIPLKGIPDLIKFINKSDGFKAPPNYDSINMQLLQMLEKKDTKDDKDNSANHCLFGFEHPAQIAYRHGMEKADGKKIAGCAVERENILRGKMDVFLTGKKKEGNK